MLGRIAGKPKLCGWCGRLTGAQRTNAHIASSSSDCFDAVLDKSDLWQGVFKALYAVAYCCQRIVAALLDAAYHCFGAELQHIAAAFCRFHAALFLKQYSRRSEKTAADEEGGEFRLLQKAPCL